MSEEATIYFPVQLLAMIAAKVGDFFHPVIAMIYPHPFLKEGGMGMLGIRRWWDCSLGRYVCFLTHAFHPVIATIDPPNAAAPLQLEYLPILTRMSFRYLDDQTLPPMIAVSMIAMIACDQASVAHTIASLENFLSEGLQANPP